MAEIHGVSSSITGLRHGKYELTLVATRNVLPVLQNVSETLKEALAEHTYGEYDYEELSRRLLTGEAQLWIVAENGARVVMLAVSRVIKYPAKRRLAVDLIVGEDIEGCAILMDIAAAWAKQFGCVEIEASCRPGIRRVMKKYGFNRAYDVIIRSIPGSTH